MTASALVPRLVVSATVLTLIPWAGTSAQDERPRQPVFRAGTELIAIDVSVVDERGHPVTTLKADEFVVSVDGTRRTVATAEFIHQGPAPQPDVPSRDLPFSSNEGAAGGRLLLLVFDGGSITPGVLQGVRRAAADFLDQLSPADRVGLLAFPGSVSVDFTADHGRIRSALEDVGARGISASEYRLGLSEAYDIDHGDEIALRRAILRECLGESDEWAVLCVKTLKTEARLLTVEGEQRAIVALRTLRAILDELRKLSAPKTVIWISEGLPLDTSRSEFGGLSAAAAAARTTIHALHLDRSHIVDVIRRTPAPNLLADRRLELNGLEVVTSVSRGAVFSTTGTGSEAFAQIARRLTGYYLLSVEATDADRDGEEHEIRISVARRGLEVRARRTFASEKAAEAPIEMQVAELLRSPLIATGLPLKVATHNLREPGDSNLRIAVSSEIGRGFHDPTRVAIGYAVRAPDGAVVATALQDRVLTPGTSGAPLQAIGLVSVPPGRYTLRLAVIDQDGRRGSVDHPFEAAIGSVGPVDVGDLLLFPDGADDGGELHASTDVTLVPAPHEAYLELYPRGGDAVSATAVVVEVAADVTGPALRSSPGRAEPSEGPRLIARGRLPQALLPPGEYVARVGVTIAGETVRQTRPFRIGRPIADTPGLRRAIAATVGAFQREDVLTPELLRPALAFARPLDAGRANAEAAAAGDALEGGDLTPLERLDRFGPHSSLLATFLRGLTYFRTGELEEAAGQFRHAFQLSPTFLPATFYLGACYAAAGRAAQAVTFWKQAAGAFGDSPAAYHVLADGYLRLADAQGAGATLHDAQAKWPGNDHWRRRLVQLAVLTDEPHQALAKALAWVGEHPADLPMVDLALRLAIVDLLQGGTATSDRLRAAMQAVERSGRRPPPLADRWLAYVDAGSTPP